MGWRSSYRQRRIGSKPAQARSKRRSPNFGARADEATTTRGVWNSDRAGGTTNVINSSEPRASSNGAIAPPLRDVNTFVRKTGGDAIMNHQSCCLRIPALTAYLVVALA